jgi:glycosyltransferase involved in cell wall biosynthesis
MQQPALSVILITRNEAAHVAGCLASVAFADEWVVVDSGSSDDTCDIARRHGATVVVTDDWPGFGAQKNRALALARGRWVLSIDADERVTPELADRIRRMIEADATGHESSEGRPASQGTLAAYEFSRLSNFCGQWMRHGDWYPDRVLRLFRRDAGRFSDDLVHERLIVEGAVGRLAGELLHDSMPTLEGALDKMNRYTSGRALDKVRAGQGGGLAAALSHGLWAFFRCYVLRRGLLDGRLGLVLALYVAEGTYYRYLKMELLARPPRRAFD